MQWIKKFKQWFERYQLRARLVPFGDASLDEWRSFAKNAPRWLVEETAKKWWNDFDDTEYWSRVNEILKERCHSFERPILSLSFVERNLERILYVKEWLRGEEIVSICKASGKKYPFFVVENTGKLLGIALNQKLVIAGVINKNLRLGEVREIHEKHGTHFLTLQDVEWFPCFEKEVSLMLSEVGLEPLGEWYWYYDAIRIPKAWNINTQQKNVVTATASVIGKF